MADTNVGALSASSNPYATGAYSASANDKNTISMTGFFKLLAAQLQNQDMTNPMDNSELMAQMTQMAMVQSLTSMTTAIETSTASTTQTYAGGLLGKEVTMAVTKENEYGQEEAIGVKYAKVESVDFTSGSPTIRLEGDKKNYALAHLLGIGRIPDPYAEKTEGEEDKEKTPETRRVSGPSREGDEDFYDEDYSDEDFPGDDIFD